MGAIAYKYLVGHILGAVFGLYGLIESIYPKMLADINISELPTPARYLFILLGAGYIWYIIMNARENYRKKKIDNDERESQLKTKHDRQHRQTK